MTIIGRGLIARALTSCDLGDVVVFAAGVSDSASHDLSAYQREFQLLQTTLHQCSREDRRLVYFSSAGRIYGEYEGRRDEQTPCLPISRYGCHKVECEMAIRAAPCAHLIVRLPNLVGAQQNPQQLIPQLVLQTLSGQATILKRATRDLLGTDRFSKILTEVLVNATDRETIVLASGISVSVDAILSQIQSLLERDVSVTFVDAGDRQEFCVDQMRRLAPNQCDFPSNYPQLLLQQYVPGLSQHLERITGTG